MYTVFCLVVYNRFLEKKLLQVYSWHINRIFWFLSDSKSWYFFKSITNEVYDVLFSFRNKLKRKKFTNYDDGSNFVSNTWIGFVMGVNHLCGTFDQFEKIPKRTISLAFDWESESVGIGYTFEFLGHCKNVRWCVQRKHR